MTRSAAVRDDWADDEADFVKQFGGECTHCHKLNKATGTWTLPSGAEK